MEFILTGEPATGMEFERLGLVNKTFARHEVLTQAKKLAEKIASMSGPVVRLAKQAVLTSRLNFQHSLFHSSTTNQHSSRRGLASYERHGCRKDAVLLYFQLQGLWGGTSGLSGKARTEVYPHLRDQLFTVCVCMYVHVAIMFLRVKKSWSLPQTSHTKKPTPACCLVGIGDL